MHTHQTEEKRNPKKKKKNDKIKAHGETFSERKDRIDNGHPIKKEVI
jgi:hypothetical protein